MPHQIISSPIAEDKLASIACGLSTMLCKKALKSGHRIHSIKYMAVFFLSLRVASSEGHLLECFARIFGNIERFKSEQEIPVPAPDIFLEKGTPEQNHKQSFRKTT